MQENKKSQGKDRAGSKQRKHEESSQPLEPLQDKMLLGKSFRRTSNILITLAGVVTYLRIKIHVSAE